MHQFKDTEGREWTIALTIGAVKRVKALTGVNLLDPLGAKRRKIGTAILKGRPLVTRLQMDPELMVNVIFALVKPTADSRGVTDEEFGESLGGDAAFQAYEAFMGEWRDFFHGLRRETEAKSIEVNAEVVRAEDRKNLALVDQATAMAEAVGERKRQEARDKMERLARGPSPTATGSPESPGSTPPG